MSDTKGKEPKKKLAKKKTMVREETKKFEQLATAKAAELPIKEWTAGKITSTNIAEFKTFQKECMKKHYDVKMSYEILPSFVDYAAGNLGSSAIFTDGQWTYEHHTYEVYGCTNSICGYYIISASRDMHINIVHQYQMKCVQRWKAHDSTIMRCRLTKDDKYLVTCSFDKSIKVWELDKTDDYTNTPKELKKLTDHTEWVYDVAIHPDESTHKLVSCSVDKTIKIWNWMEGTCLKTITAAHTDTIRTVTWSEEGDKIISGGQDALVKIWDPETGLIIRELIGHTTYVLALDVRGKRLISGSTDKTIRLWNMDTGELLRTILYHTKNVESLQFLPKSKNKILSSSLDKTIRIFDVDTGLQEYIIEGHTGGVYCAVFSPDGRFVVSASADKSVRLTKIELDKMEQNRKGFHTSIIWGVSFSPDNKWYATSSADQKIKIWDYYSYNVKHTLSGHTSHVTTVFFTTDSKYCISTSYDGTCRIWLVEDGTEVAQIADHGGKTVWYSDSRHDQKKLATAGGSFKINIYDISDITKPVLEKGLEGHTYDTLCCKWHPHDDNLVFSGSSDSTIRIWDVGAGSLVHTIKGHKSIIYQIVFLDAPYFATSSMDTTVRIWDYDGRCRNVLRGHTHPVPALCVSPDKKRLFSGGQDSQIKIWDVYTGQLEHSWRGHIAWVRNLAIDPNGERILSVSDDATVRVWKLSNILYNYFPFLKANIQDEPQTLRNIAELAPIYVTNGFYRSEFTVMHLMAYNGSVKAMKHVFHACKQLHGGRIDFSKDISGRSPMHYAFESSNLNVIEYLLNALQDYPPLLVSVFHDILPAIIALDLPSMASFIDSRMQEPMPGPKPIPKFTNSIKDPRFYATGGSVQLEDYDEMAPPREGKEKIVPIRISCVYINDFQNLAFMKAIASVEEPALFKSSAVKALLQHKWEVYAKRQYLKEFALFGLLIALFCMFSWSEVNKDDDTWIKVARYVTGIPLMLATLSWAKNELVQMKKSPTLGEYFWDLWNVFDISLVVLMFITFFLVIGAEFTEPDDETPTSDVMAWAALIYWMRLISFLRGFRKFGSMVRIIIEIIKDVRYFMVILILTIVGFAQAVAMFEVNAPKHVGNNELKLQYQLMLGDWDTEGYESFAWLFFLLGSFFGMLIMLNLLIALMTETYVRIQQEAEANAYKEWAQWIYDIDKEANNNPLKPNLEKYLFTCMPIEVGEDDREITAEEVFDEASEFRLASNKLANKVKTKLDKKLKKTEKLIKDL